MPRIFFVPAILFSFLFLFLKGPFATSLSEAENLDTERSVALKSTEITFDKYFFRELAEETSPAVVNILALKKFPRFYGDFHYGMPGTPKYPLVNDFKKEGEGSGFIIDKEGYILTASHVVSEADQLQVTLFDRKMFRGRVVGYDKSTDIALIKIDAPFDLPVLPLGDSQKLRPGDWVMTIGSPFGLELTVTIGIVSAKSRSLGRSPYDEYIQIDAPVNPGSSGGPLINNQGEVVGINAAIIAKGQGLGFSVPINLAKTYLPQLKEKGRIVRSWMGIVVQNITLPKKEMLELNFDQGSLVMNVILESPAEKAGIMPNDVIIEFDGKPVKNSHEFPRRIAKSASGKKIPLKLIRENKVITIEVMLEEVPESGLR